MRFGLALVIALAIVSEARAKVITSIERLDDGDLPFVRYDPPSPTFMTHTQIWRDYTFIWGTTPNYLRGADQVLTSLNQDTPDPDFQLRLSLSQPAFVYLLIDDRLPSLSQQMPWVAQLGFADSGEHAVMNLAGNLVNASIYRGTFPAGDLVLLQQNTSPNVAFMYTVGVTPVPEPGMGLVVAGALLFVQRPRRRRSKSRSN
jgi:hypothetical protein